MKNIFLKNLFIVLLVLFSFVSCAKKQKAKQHFTLNIAALQTGLPISGGSFVRAISPASNTIIKLDDNDSAVFEFGNWDFQVVSFEGPTSFLGKRYCGRIVGFNLDANQINAELTLNQTNCYSEPFISLISEINKTFANNSLITVTKITPDNGATVGGTNVTINGTRFFSGALVDVGGSTCTSPVVVNSTTITCVTSSHAAGTSDVKVTNLDATSSTIANAFMFRPPPTVSNVSLSAGPLSGLATVTITGTGFYSGASVTFDGIPCTLPIVLNSTTISCSTPAHAAGAIDVVVTNADSQTGTLVGGYVYQPAPTVSSVALNSGALAGGASVTISGTGFLSGATASFGGAICNSLIVVSSTSITCTTSAHIAGAVNVVVTNSDNQSAIAVGAYTYRAAPSVTSVALNSGALAGGTNVTIAGTGFYSSSVKFGGVSATSVVVNSPTSISCTTPANSAGAVNVVVTNGDNQTGTGVGLYTYRAAPTVTSVTPNFGDFAGGTTVTISGTGFYSGATANLGGSNCTSPAVVSSTSITCVTTAHAIASVAASVTNADTQSGNLGAAYNYQDVTPPVVSGLAFNDGVSEWSATASPTFTWNAATDATSGVSYYEIAIGTTAGNNDVVNWTNVGNVTSYQFTGLSLTRGQTYFASIRATDAVGNTSAAVSGDGWIVKNEMWVTNREVDVFAQSGNTLYLGGSFTEIGEWTGGGVPLDSTTALVNWPNPMNKARVSGTVLTSVSDGSGGYFIGGKFSSVGGIARNNLAHVLADGSVDSWNPNANYTVNSILLNGGILYAGGYFYKVNGSVTRNGLAAFDATTGVVTSWDPNVSGGGVFSIAINGSSMFVGGQYTGINGGASSRNNLSEVNLTTGTATSWNPNVNSIIYTLLVNGSNVYVGGGFSTVNGGTTRNCLAAFNISTGTATSWNPNVNSYVRSIVTDGTKLYAGGDFSTVNGGAGRLFLASFDLVNGVVQPTTPDFNGTVYSLALNGTTLYAGGGFTSLYNGTVARDKLVSFDTTTGVVSSWHPHIGNTVNTIAINGSSIFAGGNFSTANSVVTRGGLAAIDLKTGSLTSWNPNVDLLVSSIILNGTTVYVGGFFSTANGSTNRHNLAAFDSTTGIVTSWNPNVNGAVNSMVLNGGTLYIGGNFTTINGSTSRNNLAAVNLITGVATSWNPNVNNTVYAMGISGSTLYAGGYFTSANSSITRNYAAAFDLSTGTATAWNPNLSNWVNSLLINGTTIYLGGVFSTVNGSTTRNYLAAFDLTTGTATAWAPNPMGQIYSLATDGTNLFVGGNFSTVNGSTTRNYLATLNLSTGIATAFNPNINMGEVLSILPIGGDLYIGGRFTGAGMGAGYSAPIDLTTGLWRPGY